MRYKTMLGKNDFLESLRAKKADFLFFCSYSLTCEIDGILGNKNQENIYLKNILDFEFLCTGELRSLDNTKKNKDNLFTSTFVKRAVHLNQSFSSLEFLDLGAKKLPDLKHFKIHNFDLHFSKAINQTTSIRAFDVFQKGLDFATNYASSSDYIVLSNNVLAGDVNALALIKALDYQVKSSKKRNNIEEKVINESFELSKSKVDLFEKISLSSDNNLIFLAGFLLGNSSSNRKILLECNIQSISVLLLVNSIINEMNAQFDSKNLALCYDELNTDLSLIEINEYLELCDFKINLYSSSLEEINLDVSSFLSYASINNIKEKELLDTIQNIKNN